MSLIYQKTNYENENKIKFIKNILKHDKYEINKNENKISSSSNNFYHIHSAIVSNVENVEKNINIKKNILSSSNLLGSDCNYVINSNNGSNMFALYSKNGNQKMNENLSLINSQNSNDNQKFLSLVESQNLNENNQNLNENHQNLNENNQNENENLQNLNENNQNENENNQNLNENNQNLNENHLNENDYFQNENDENENENNQNENENNQNEEDTVENENDENENNQNENKITNINDIIKNSLKKYSNKLFDDNKGAFLKNFPFNEIKIIENKEDENKKIIYKNEKNQIIMNILFKITLEIDNYKWKFIPIENYKLEEKIIEKYSLNFIKKTSIIDIKKDN